MTQRKILLLIAGNAGAGKDTLGGYLKEVFEPWGTVRLDAFAYTLKNIAHQTTGAPWHILNGDKTVKESTFFDVAGEQTDITIRRGLQDIGEWFRERFSTKVWANSVRLRAQAVPERVTIVTDCRHPREEIFWMREVCADFAHVFVARIRNSRVPVKRGHPSEDRIADEADASFDFIVENEGSLADLQEMAQELACGVLMLDKTNKRKVKRSGEGWLVQAPGLIPFEPQLTKRDAAVLARSLNLSPSCVVPSTYKHLRGLACG